MRGSKLYVNLSAIDFNLKSIKSSLSEDTDIMPVIKATGYGTGDVGLKDTLLKNNINIVAVALTEEGVNLRKNDFKMPIVILNQPLIEEIPYIVDNILTPGIAVLDFAKQLNEYSKEKNVVTKVHVEIDTGMGRVGVKPKEAISFIKELKKLSNIEVEGIYAHFSSADTSEEYTNMQIENFEFVLNELKKENIEVKYKHTCNSAGTMCYPKAHYNLVRPGISIYGYYPDKAMRDKIELKPSAVLKSKVSFIKEVDVGTSISYNRRFITDRKSIIATVPLGYADGIRRSLTNKGRVYINGNYANIVGTVCMDSFMIDVTDIPNVKINDEVIIFDNEHITLEELASKCDTINYEILSGISNRVPREYVK